MDLRDLHYFEVIAELEHVGKASERLHRTQPALTSCVRRLEEDCGALLFEKTGRGIRLTAAGKALLKWAQRTRTDVESARREIGEIGQGLAGNIRVGIVPTAAQFLLPPAARQLVADAPAVTMQITVALVDALHPLLRAGDLDLVVGSEAATEQGLVSKLLAEDQIVVAASATHEVFSTKATLKGLTTFKWVLQPAGAPTRDWLDQMFTSHHLPRPVVQVESNLLLMLPTLIQETGLLSFISRLHLKAGRSGAALREVELPATTMHRRLVVTHRDSGYVSPAAERLITLLEKVAGAPLD